MSIMRQTELCHKINFMHLLNITSDSIHIFISNCT